MRRLFVAAVVLSLACGLFCFAEELPCRVIPPTGIFWLASYDDESPRTETNYADIVQASDEYGDYYGMAWNSPEDTDLTIGELDQYNLSGVTAIKLTLSATERITVRPYAGLGGEYCGKIGRFVVAEPIIVGPDCQDYEFDVSGFGEEDPLRGCSGPLAEDALESLYSMVLLPDDRAGELRVYEVALCGEDIAQAAESSQDVSIPEFTIDPDVTRDSVVQIGDGPQELSTDIKFYPNTRRAKPGDTVYWTLEIGEGSGLEPPYTIVPEMDNDSRPEARLESSARAVAIEHAYDTAGAYVPYLSIIDGSGIEILAYTKNVLAVLDESSPPCTRQLQLPTDTHPESDIVKAITVLTVDPTFMDSQSGQERVRTEIARWASVGFNLVIYNVIHYTRDENSCVILPRYVDAWPAGGAESLTYEHMAFLAAETSQEGMAVGFRYLTAFEGEYDGAYLKTVFSPFDEDSYFDYHTQFNMIEAEVAEQLGACCYGLDTESLVFSLSPRAIEILRSVKRVFSGWVFDSPMTDLNVVYRSPLLPYLDVIYFSYNPNQLPYAGYSSQNLYSALRADLLLRMEPLLEFYGVPGIFETYFKFDRRHPAFQATAFEAQLEAFKRSMPSMMGMVIWEGVLDSGFSSFWDPMHRSAENVVRKYLIDLIPDRQHFSPTESTSPPPANLVLSDFETQSDISALELWEQGQVTRLSLTAFDVAEGYRSLCVQSTASASEDELMYSFLWSKFVMPTDISRYHTMAVWLKHDGDVADVLFNVIDSDGDRFSVTLYNRAESSDWICLSAPLELFSEPEWARGQGNGAINWSEITEVAIALLYRDGQDHINYIDTWYLSEGR